MKPIKITKSNEDAIVNALHAINGRATAFTITHFYEVMAIADKAEAKLHALPKADRKGVVATYTPEGPSRAYKYSAKSTQIKIHRRATGWFLTSVDESKVWPRQPQRLVVTVTSDQANQISKAAVANFAVAA